MQQMWHQLKIENYNKAIKVLVGQKTKAEVAVPEAPPAQCMIEPFIQPNSDTQPPAV